MAVAARLTAVLLTASTLVSWFAPMGDEGELVDPDIPQLVGLLPVPTVTVLWSTTS
ncbi:hypothetical protein AB4Z18_17325 [Leifsonia sp. 2TAF2]|uniref:hypothetical protein n=1 Tax=Leifsonia sp. 2TAF2 TaxID=3233009 RepID=UPI003F984FFE